jgi:hypothetical protein
MSLPPLPLPPLPPLPSPTFTFLPFLFLFLCIPPTAATSLNLDNPSISTSACYQPPSLSIFTSSFPPLLPRPSASRSPADSQIHSLHSRIIRRNPPLRIPNRPRPIPPFRNNPPPNGPLLPGGIRYYPSGF